MKKLDDFCLKLGASSYRPIVTGGMGVDISTAALALEAASIGAIGHISDAMVPFVSDKHYKTNFSQRKSEQNREFLKSMDKSKVKFDLNDLYQAQVNHVENTMNRKRGDGAIFINVMEKLTMGSPMDTIQARLRGALDGGIDGITLSAGLHNNTLRQIADHPRFRDTKIGIIVSSHRALKIFLRSAQRVDRMPDYVVVEGPLAGGHLGFGDDWQDYNLKDIVSEVVDFLKKENLSIPVIAAGGVFTGTDATEICSLGASGVQVATRLTVTEECGLPTDVKQVYFGATEKDIVVNHVSPTGYPMRMLTSSPCLTSNIRPNCEAFGYILNGEGKCQYIDAYENTPVDASGKKEIVKDKICLCYHFSKCQCYTCGHYVYRLKDTSEKGPDGRYKLLKAKDVIEDYLFSTDHKILTGDSSSAVTIEDKALAV